jgi:hypothetical protein
MASHIARPTESESLKVDPGFGISNQTKTLQVTLMSRQDNKPLVKVRALPWFAG